MSLEASDSRQLGQVNFGPWTKACITYCLPLRQIGPLSLFSAASPVKESPAPYYLTLIGCASHKSTDISSKTLKNTRRFQCLDSCKVHFGSNFPYCHSSCGYRELGHHRFVPRGLSRVARSEPIVVNQASSHGRQQSRRQLQLTVAASADTTPCIALSQPPNTAKAPPVGQSHIAPGFCIILNRNSIAPRFLSLSNHHPSHKPPSRRRRPPPTLSPPFTRNRELSLLLSPVPTKAG